MGRSRQEGSCCRDMLQERVAGTKSQHEHTDENNAATCFSDILQRHVPSCELTLLLTVQHQFGGDFVPATFPMKFELIEFHGTRRRTKQLPKRCCTVTKISVHMMGHVAATYP